MLDKHGFFSLEHPTRRGYIYIYMIEAYKIMRVRDRVESQDLFSQGGNVKD